jgi:arylsulfatase A-like enzyme
LIGVPFVIRFPGQTVGRRIQAPVSTLQVFYTLLELAKVDISSQEERLSERLETLSLARMSRAGFEFPNPVIGEAYAPDYILKVVDGNHPKLHELYPVRSTQRAVYSPERLKMIQIDRDGSTLFDIKTDAAEKHPLPADEHQPVRQQLEIGLKLFLEEAATRQPENWSRRSLQIEDEAVLQRLRGLGYLD